MRHIDDFLTASPVVPVLTIDRLEDAVPIAHALVEGGLPIIEVTLRTEVALAAIRAMKAVPGAVIGAGTILNGHDIDRAVAAGAEFLVSPGLTEALGQAASRAPVPLLPGVASTSDVMRAIEHGFTRLKYFPAMAAGGLPMLKGLAAIFPSVRFCPTGGLSQESAPEWLALPSVLCVGGSWLVPASGQRPDPDGIRARARAAALLRQPQ